jgi:hypothetical protein
MKNLTDMTEPSAPPIVAGPECSICGKPMHAPKEIGTAIKGALDEIRRDVRGRLDVAKESNADEITLEMLARESLELWTRLLFPNLEEWSAELQGAHAACVANATRERRKGAS